MRIIPVAAALLAITVATVSAHAQSTPGAVELTGHGSVSQSPTLPKLALNNAQRETIRQAVLTQHTDVQFQLKATKPDKNFTPSLGAKLPKGLSPVSLPLQVVRNIPQLANYKYLTMKDKVLIVNPMSDQIVDMFSETQPVT